MPVERRDPAVLHFLRRHGRQGRHDHDAHQSARPEAEDLRHGEGWQDDRGFGWKRWSTAWLHERLGLFGDYRVRYWTAPESAPSR